MSTQKAFRAMLVSSNGSLLCRTVLTQQSLKCWQESLWLVLVILKTMSIPTEMGSRRMERDLGQ